MASSTKNAKLAIGNARRERSLISGISLFAEGRARQVPQPSAIHESGTLLTPITKQTPVTRDHLKGLPATLCAGVAIWCSLGTVGLIEGTSTNGRAALIAPWWSLPVSVAAVFGA